MIDARARGNSGARNGLRFLLRGVSALLAVLFITSCGDDIFIVGTPVITLTAQRGPFTSYIVTLDEIEMTRKDGTIIELPMVSERVDLANLGQFVQLLGAPAVGEGTYVSATFFLDYSSPWITADNNGTAVPTTLIDSSTGAAPTVDTITVNFDPNNPLVIGNQTSSLVNFNIDLEASNTITTDVNGVASVTVHPMFTVTAAPVYQTPVFTRGLFVFTDTKAGNFVMNTRPLHDVLNNPFGALTVIPNDQTYWNINGVTFVGAAGLTALSALQSQTASLQIGAVGTAGNPFGGLTGVTPTFTATQIYVGSSLESTIQDHITGIVAAHAGNTLTVIRALSVDREGLYGFSDSVPVTVASTTIVSVDGVANPSPVPTVDTVSVGQFIDVSGLVTEISPGSGDLDEYNPLALDATFGQIRLQPTSLWGTLNSAAAGSASVSLGWVEHLEPTLISFAGTGTSPSLDATAATYTVNTGTTDESATAPGTLLNFIGLTNLFGSGPPDFTASTVMPASALPQQLILEWSGNGTVTPFSSVVGGTMYVNLQDPTLIARYILSGPQLTDVLSLPNPNPAQLALVPATGTPQSQFLFTIGGTANGMEVYSDPATFAARVPHFTALNPVTKIVANGQYDGAGNFVATDIKIAIY